MKNLKFSVRLSVVSLATIVILLSGGLISLLYHYATKHSVHELVESMMEKISHHTIDKTLSYLHDAPVNGEITEFMFTEGLLQANNFSQLERNFHSILKANTQFVSVMYGDEISGNFIMAKKMPDNSISIKQILRKGGKAITTWKHENKSFIKEYTDKIEEDEKGYDPRKRSWYKDSKAKKDHIWTDVYIFETEKKPGLTYSTPIIKGDKLLGVLGIDIGIEGISYFLGKVKIGKTGKAFIINKDYKIVAHPLYEGEKFHELDESHGDDEEDHEIINSIHAFREYAKGKTFQDLKVKHTFFEHVHEGEEHLNMYYAFSGHHEWMIGIVVPEDDFMYIAKRNNMIILIISFVLIFIAVIIGVVFSRKISKPLSQLGTEMDNIKNFQLDSNIEISSSLIEVEQMAQSFVNMKKGLQSFKKYVPADLVRELISMGKEANLGGEKKTLTIYFSDIAGFTSISEAMKPEELVLHLGEYMASSSRTIIDNKGTIDKYIGDAIMAFWGAPAELPEHAKFACRSALLVKSNRKELEKKWKETGKPVIKDRIGINTGEMIVGNIGSDNRLNYTVIGDSVNLASRIEGLNKYYGTEIMISESTHALVKEDFDTRKLDFVAVKGKATMVTVYELLGEKNSLTKELKDHIALYESGLENYLQRNWKQAIENFEKSLKLRPDDLASEVFIKRCKDYSENPPPKDWTGVYQMTSK